MRLFYIILMCCLLFFPGSGFSQQFNVKTYSFGEGLKTYNIIKALEDRFGFIWLATQDGVYRFDGTNFESYRKGGDESSSIRENFIFDITLGKDDKLYVASFNAGIDVIDTRTQKVTHLLSGTKGLEEGLPNLWISKILCDAENNLWIGGKDYLRVYNLAEKKYKEFQQPRAFSSGIHVSFIKPVNESTVVVGVNNYGMVFYNTASLKILDTVNRLANMRNVTISDFAIAGVNCYLSSGADLFNGKFENGVWKEGKMISIPAISNNTINCLATGKKNELWLGTNSGLGSLDLLTGQFKPIENTEFIKADNSIADLFQDRENGLWISSKKNLIRMNLDPSPFYACKGSRDGSIRMNHLYSLVPVNKAQLFACGTDGLYLCDIDNRQVKRVKGTSALGIIHYTLKITEDFWIISSDNGMYGYIPSTETISKDVLLQNYPEWKPFVTNYFNNTVRFKNKIYWASEEQEGLLIWDFEKHSLRQCKSGVPGSRGLPENHMHNLKYDKDGFIWMLFDNAVAKFNPSVDSVVQVIRYARGDSGFNAGIFFDLYDDGSVLWFGTFGGGINGYHKKTGEWTHITEESGLCNNAVYGILPESDSIFWVSTNNGISRVNYKSGKCLNYYADDGLQDNSFDEKGALLHDEKLFFAGVGGFTIIDLANYRNHSFPFPVYIKRVDYIEKNKKVALKDLNWKKVKLPAGTTNATIWLSALTYSSNKPRFSYKIKGFQDEYVPAGDKNQIELNALSYGTYPIDIRYFNEKGEYVERSIGLELEIAPYWYQTWWFRLLISLLFFSIMIFIVRLVYTSRIRKQKALLEKQLAVQIERQRISSEMHDDIGAGLSGIKLLTEITKSKIKDEATSREVEKIYDSVGDISAKMKEVIWSLNTENDQLSSLISYLQMQVRHWLANYSCRINFNIAAEIPDIEISGESRRNILLVIKEAIHNIIKHSGADHVNITITCTDRLIISITDNGRGLQLEEGYTGNGLKNMRRRIQQLNGKYFIQSNGGLTLIFEVPFRSL